MRQPKILPLLVFVKMWQYFSHYGNRALLVLYMISQLEFPDHRAYEVYAVYCSLVELSGIAGGLIADKWLGLKRTCFIGGWLIAVGHLIIAFDVYFFHGMAFIVMGTGLFATNISALLGQFYEKHDQRRERGYTLFYIGMNIGAFIATLTCGFAAESLGWHAGFGLAAGGMLIGNGIFLFCLHLLKGKGEAVGKCSYVPAFFVIGAVLLAIYFAIDYSAAAITLLPIVLLLVFIVLAVQPAVSRLLKKMALALAALVLFFSAEEQMGSSLLVFMEKMTSKEVMGISILPAAALAVNPFIIISLGSIFTFGAVLKRHRLPIAFALSGIGFIFLTLAPFIGPPFPMGIVMMTMMLISCAELLVGPYVFSCASESAVKGKEGLAMALLPLGFSMASLVGGGLSKLVASADGAEASLEIYGRGFGLMAVFLFIASAVMSAVSRSKSLNPCRDSMI